MLYSDEIMIIDVISVDLSKASNLHVKPLALFDAVGFAGSHDVFPCIKT